MKGALSGRPLFLWVSLFIIGEVLGFYLDLPFLVYPLFFLSLIALTILITKVRLSWLFLVLSLALPLGFWLVFTASHPADFEFYADIVWGEVESEPHSDYGRTTYFLRVGALEDSGVKRECDLRLYVIAPEGEGFARGDLLKIKGTVLPPEGELAEYLRKERCFWVFRASQSEKIGTSLTTLGAFFKDLQSGVQEEIDRVVPYPANQILSGILIGRVASMEPSATLPFKESGTSHILAASGTNVVLLVSFFLLVAQALPIRKKTTLLLSIPFLILYATVCGWLPSITRATVTVLVGILSVLIKRDKDFPTTLAFAAFVVLIMDPMALFFLDFQLSFLASACLLAFVPEMQRWVPGRAPRILKDSLMTTIASQIGVAPLVAENFHNLSLIAPLANLVILPLVSLILPLGLISLSLTLILPPLGRPLLWIAGQGTALIQALAKGLGEIPLAYLIVPGAPSWLKWLYWGTLFLSLTILLLGFRKKTRAIAARLMAGLFLVFVLWLAFFPILFPPQLFEAHFIDVGQGDSILIRTPDRANFLWDAGSGSKSLKYLEELGINQLDLVFVSHPHSDHINGLFPILDNIPVKMVLLSKEGEGELQEKLKAELDKRNIPYIGIGEGFTVKGETFSLQILAPPGDTSSWTLNDRSLVGKFTFGETDFLLTGDIEDKGRKNLKNKGNLSSEILKVPHHGSANSLDKDFLDMVSPLVAIISVSQTNSYGHPSIITLELLREQGIWTLLTSKQGSILVKSDGKIITIEKER